MIKAVEKDPDGKGRKERPAQMESAGDKSVNVAGREGVVTVVGAHGGFVFGHSCKCRFNFLPSRLACGVDFSCAMSNGA